MPKANSWRAPGCVCVHVCMAHHCSRAAGLEDLRILVPATEESSSGSRLWSQLQDGGSWALEGSIVYMYVCMCFLLTGSSWSARAGKRIRLFVLCLHVCSALCLRPVVYSVCAFIYVHALYTWGFSGHECLLGIHAQACYWLYPEDMELNSLFSTRPADSAAPNIWRGPPFSEQGQPEQVAF